ncbi:hypothetical protein BASA81_001216 [Batrachochytrium salamandrivorans]|nr:hypothetical protein BASA81_001216 [Batrachochytrium salamandrivorans]
MQARLASYTDVQFDAGVAAWCSEMERTKDFTHFAQLVSRPSVQTSTNNKLAQLVGLVVGQVEANSPEATRAFYSLLSQQPSSSSSSSSEQIPTKLLSKHHAKLLAHFEARMDSQLYGLGAKCFALLSSMLHKPDWSKAFDSLVTMLQQCLAKKNLVGFQNAIVGLVEFMSKPRQVPITPGKLVVVCRRAVDVNTDFAKSALCLVEELARRLGRVGLPWAGTLCEAVDVCFEEPLIRPNAYNALRCLQEVFGLVVGSKFAPLLATTIKADWSSALLEESTIMAGVACVAAFYQTGAASVLPAALRGEIDSVVLDATAAAMLRTKSVELRAAFLDLLLLACTCPTVEGDSAVLRSAVSLFQSVVCSAREDSRLVKPSARRALAMCAFRATSCLPPVRQFVVTDVAPQFATATSSAAVLTSFSEARFVVTAAVAEEVTEAAAEPLQPAYQPVTQEETEEEDEEEDEEEEQSGSNKRVQLMPQQSSSHEANSDSDSDDDDIPDIV